MEVVLAFWHAHDQAICVEILHADYTIFLLEHLFIKVLYEHTIIHFKERFVFEDFILVLTLLDDGSVFRLGLWKIRESQERLATFEVEKELPRDVFVHPINLFTYVLFLSFVVSCSKHLMKPFDVSLRRLCRFLTYCYSGQVTH